MRAPLLAVVSLALGGTLACGALTGVDWDQVKVRGDGGASSGASGGTSGASGGTSGGTSGTSGGPTGACAEGQVECLAADGIQCCANGGEPGPPITIAANAQNSCAISTTGQIKCWGANSAGQLGRGALGPSATTPQLVYRIPKGATKVAVGGSHVCALVGSLFACWGGNGSGQLGNGSTTNELLPVVVPLSAPPDAIGAGAATTCASIGGAGRCWGSNTASQAGSETEPLRVLTPGPVKGLPALATSGDVIAAARDHACASGASQLFCWGTNTANRLGSAGPSQSAAALVVTGGAGPASRVALGDSHGCALRAGAVQCWGSNVFGELGNDSVGAVSSGAITPTGLDSGVTSLCAGGLHTCVIQGAVVKCFGDNSQGQGGFAQGAARIATMVQSLTGFLAKDLACGQFHTCAISVDGAIKCWGQNQNGELGDGSADMKSSVPRDVKW